MWAVTRGRRCALALWHTWAPEHREQVSRRWGLAPWRARGGAEMTQGESWERADAGGGKSASTLLLTLQEWMEAKELLRGPEKDEGEDVASRDPGPEPPSRRLPRLQDKAGKPPRIREEL